MEHGTSRENGASRLRTAATLLVAVALSVGFGVRPAAAATTVVATPLPSGTTESSLDGVACPADDDCWAVGSTTGTGAARRFVLRWNGTNWSAVSTPLPTGTTESSLHDVTCVTATDCWAVGSATVSGSERRLILRWNGTAWSVIGSSLPTGAAGSWLSGVACANATNCWAVGLVALSGFPKRLILRWNGSTWSFVTSPLPIGTTTSYLGDVACASSSNCWAVGTFVAGNPRRLLLRWNGTTWSIATTPLPTGTTESELLGATCVSASDCWAVGLFVAGSQRRLLLHWNGTAWSIVSTPLPTGTTSSTLVDVTCASSSDCWAVGFANPDRDRRVVMRWNGTAWSIVTTPLPGGTTDSGLLGVACSAVGRCWAVGVASGTGFSARLVIRFTP